MANYAFNVAKVLQTPHMESHALSWDYYHINARPEWEEADFDSSDIGDAFFPRFPSEAYRNFTVPGWYSHGQMKLSALYLVALNERKRARAWFIRKVNERYLRRISSKSYRERQTWMPTARILEGVCLDLMGEGRWNTIKSVGAVLRGWQRGKPLKAPSPAPQPDESKADISEKRGRLRRAASSNGIRRPVPPPPRELPDIIDLVDHKDMNTQVFFQNVDRAQVEARLKEQATNLDFNDLYDRFVADQAVSYISAYPKRDINPWLLLQFKPSLPLLKRLFKGYDLVIGYGIEGIWPMAAGKPYMAYEFGTIRNIPFTDSDQGRLGFLAYRNAQCTIVTNCDVQSAAEALKLDYFFLPHVINEGGLPTPDEEDKFRSYVEETLGGDFFVFHPARQHWGPERDTNWDKGNDHFFRGFAELVRTVAPNARCIAVEWGESLRESKRLVRALGIAANVTWIKPQPHASMMRYIAACDVVADQFTITTFGGIPPKAFYVGKPVISAFDPAVHQWCFEEMPPIQDCRSAKQVAAALTLLYRDPDHRALIAEKGTAWYNAFNSNARIRDILSAQVLDVLSNVRSETHDPRDWTKWKPQRPRTNKPLVAAPQRSAQGGRSKDKSTIDARVIRKTDMPDKAARAT